MTQIEAEIIVGLADHGLRIAAAAKALFMARNTLVYHVQKIRNETGLNPFDFHDMCYLLPKAKTVLGKYGTFVTDGGAKND